MAHFAELDSDNTVMRVIVVSNNDIIGPDGTENEGVGIAFCRKLFGADTNWKQTSYNGNMRGRYAGKGMFYNEIVDAFLAEKPYASWVLDSTTKDWISPLGTAPERTEDMITAKQDYVWDEDVYQADTSDPKTAGWVLTTEPT